MTDRKRRRTRNRKVAVYAVVAAIAMVAVVAIAVFRSEPTSSVPADGPTPTEGLGIFAPVAGRILYVNGGTDLAVGANDLNYYEPGLYAVDPDGPSDTTEGPRVGDDVDSTLVRLELDEGALSRGLSHDEPQLFGWSSDGSELLFTPGRFEQYLYILHADGSVTRVNAARALNPNAAISPDGSRVVCLCNGFNIVDADGGSPEQLPFPGSGESDDGAPDGGQPKEGEPLGPMTFSPDGTQIAYLVKDGVWVVNADGTDAHEMVANEATREALGWFSGLQWSPADRIAIGLGHDGRRPAIYTFAPDGSHFTQVITGGWSPYWSPDASQIAYTIPCDEHPTPSCPQGRFRSWFDPQPGDSPAGLAIADADGSNVRAFGFAASGPWHPGE